MIPGEDSPTTPPAVGMMFRCVLYLHPPTPAVFGVGFTGGVDQTMIKKDPTTVMRTFHGHVEDVALIQRQINTALRFSGVLKASRSSAVPTTLAATKYHLEKGSKWS